MISQEVRDKTLQRVHRPNDPQKLIAASDFKRALHELEEMKHGPPIITGESRVYDSLNPGAPPQRHHMSIRGTFVKRVSRAVRRLLPGQGTSFGKHKSRPVEMISSKTYVPPIDVPYSDYYGYLASPGVVGSSPESLGSYRSYQSREGRGPLLDRPSIRSGWRDSQLLRYSLPEEVEDEYMDSLSESRPWHPI